MSAVSEVAAGPASCLALNDVPDNRFTGLISSANNGSCTFTFTMTVDPLAPDGSSGTLTFMTGALGNPVDVVRATATVLGVDLPTPPSIEVTLSDETPSLGDIVTVTAALTNPSDGQAEVAALSVGLPNGVTLVAGSSGVTCGGASCSSTPTQELPPFVSGLAN